MLNAKGTILKKIKFHSLFDSVLVLIYLYRAFPKGHKSKHN